MKATDPSALLSRVDHLVYAVPDLDRGIAYIEQLLGIRATLGGRHVGRGTHNALLALGPRPVNTAANQSNRPSSPAFLK